MCTHHGVAGASSDVDNATRLARAMVTQYAMSDKVGPVLHKEGETVSSATQELIEREVKKLLQVRRREGEGGRGRGRERGRRGGGDGVGMSPGCCGLALEALTEL